MTKGYNYFRTHLKVVLVLVALVLISSILFFYVTTQKQEELNRGSFAITDPALREEQLKKLQQDSDRDGLRDWEETLYHTDAQKSDTDGDGTLDGEEVKLGRDPAVPGPDDLMATSTPLQDASDGQAQNLTKQLAEKIAREMIVRRIANPDTPFDTDTTAQNLVDAVLESAPGKIQYSLSEKDIVVGHSDSKASVQTYQTAMLRIIETNAKALTSKPYIQIFVEAMQAQDYEKLKALDPYLAEYDQIIAQLKKLSVPPRLAALHLEYVNLIIEQTHIARTMRGAEDDPLSTLVVLKQYRDVQERFEILLNEFTSKYQKIGV